MLNVSFFFSFLLWMFTFSFFSTLCRLSFHMQQVKKMDMFHFNTSFVVAGLGLEGLLPSRSKVQHLLGVNNSLGPHPLVKSQRLTLIRVGKLPRVRCTDPMGLVEVRVSWPGHPRLSKKKTYCPIWGALIELRTDKMKYCRFLTLSFC